MFLNHFQLLVRYDVDTDLLLDFPQNKATHISDHIHELQRRKRLIKVIIPPEFFLEWFLKSRLPYIYKDVFTLGVTTEEEEILKAHQLDLIYAKFRICLKLSLRH